MFWYLYRMITLVQLRETAQSSTTWSGDNDIDINNDIDNDNDNDNDIDIDIDINMKKFLMIPRLTNEQMNEEAGCGVRDIMIGSQSLKTIRNNCI